MHRSTVARAIAALEGEGVLTWENRLVRQRVAIQGLFGPQWVLVPRRTSNAYRFHDYRRDAFGRPVDLSSSPKSQRPMGTPSQENQKLAHEQAERGAAAPLDPSHPLEAASAQAEPGHAVVAVQADVRRRRIPVEVGGATVLGALKDGRCASAAARCCASLTAPARRSRPEPVGTKGVPPDQPASGRSNKGLSKDGGWDRLRGCQSSR